MIDIIQPIEREILKSELTSDRLLRNTNKASNEIYVITAHNAPNVMQEIGRLREESFRMAGGGTGLEVDIDDSDTAEDGYNQLIVWDPKAEEIVGGYRFIVCQDSHTKHLSIEHYFNFSDKFREEYLPYTIELGRSFVQPHYQGTRTNPKGIYALDNLWDGLGALMVFNPKAKYFLGKVTMYENYNKQARNTLLSFLDKYFADKESLVTPIFPMDARLVLSDYATIFTGEDYAENYKILNRTIRDLNENIPPLINSYMNLSPTMKCFGAVCNPDFGGVEETGILITMDDMYPEKVARHKTF
ncbi:MAG: GNAT family N-acetyltransferase [Rikenellaceae bacterium]